MDNELNLLEQRKVLGKDFRIFGTKENPLFSAKDVAEWIEYSQVRPGVYKTSQMVETIDDEEKLMVTMLLPGDTQARTHTFLTEDGLYEVLMQSRKPIAKQFKKEVKKILKQIRQTGGTVIAGREEEFIKNYFPSFSEDVQMAMVLDLQRKNEEYKKQIEKSKPKVDYYERVI